VAGLTNLDTLYCSTNNVTDISPVAGLTKLTELGFYQNQITDITPVSSLTNLSELLLPQNQITDLSPVAGLTKLTRLGVGYNRVSDVAVVAGLPNLSYLDIQYNDVTDIAPVNGLAYLANLYIKGNYIDLTLGSPGMTTIAALQSRGVSVSYAPQRIAYTIQPTAGASGSISPGTGQRLIPGKDCTFTVTPDARYHIVDVLVDGQSVGPVSSYTFASVTSNHTISASFAANTSAFGIESGSNSSLRFGSTFNVRGTLAGIASQHRTLPGERVILQSAAPGAAFKDTSLETTTGVGGKYAFTVKPNTKTFYRVRFAGSVDYPASVSLSTFATPQVRLSRTTSWSTLSCYKTYYSGGFIEPRHYSTDAKVVVKAYKRRSNGTYSTTPTRTYSSSSRYIYYSSTKTKYRIPIKLTSKGYWKLVAYHKADSKNAATNGSSDIVYVK